MVVYEALKFLASALMYWLMIVWLVPRAALQRMNLTVPWEIIDEFPLSFSLPRGSELYPFSCFYSWHQGVHRKNLNPRDEKYINIINHLVQQWSPLLVWCPVGCSLQELRYVINIFECTIYNGSFYLKVNIKNRLGFTKSKQFSSYSTVHSVNNASLDTHKHCYCLHLYFSFLKNQVI